MAALLDSSLTPARYCHAEQKCDEQARERGFAGNRAEGGERLSRPPGGCDSIAQPLDRGLKGGGDVADGARNIGRRIDGAVRHAGLEWRLGCFDAHVPMPLYLRL
jgi:hypothetical protein